MKLTKDFKEFLELLNKNNVEYLIVGAYALSVYGYVRNTGDIDIWISISIENANKVLITLHEFGFSSLQISETDLLKENSVIQLGYEPVRIDLLTSVSGLRFSDCWINKLTETIDGILINTISLSDLRTNKKSTGRTQDLADLENLPEK